ncbi:MAG: family 1 glycosylhydrolase [Clostridia bacterium]|nr:family 1 glycosylhydrolase [Clostridia bacterium]
MVRFPSDFIWGVACASYQCEGGWDADGKGPSIWDDFCHRFGGSPVKNNDNGDIACDSYHRYPEDIALMKRLNIQAYRFSISWARVMPDGDGPLNEAGLAYYDDLVDRLLANGIEPMITLYHWDLPSALQYRGGWLNREMVDIFARYAEVIAKRFKGRVKKYMTINEPQCVALGYYSEGAAPGWRCPEEDVARLFHILALSHSAAQRAIKAVDPEALVGLVPCGKLCCPVEDTPEGRQSAYRATFEMSKEPWRWAFNTNIILDSVILRRYDDSAPAPVRKFAATVPQGDWEAMEAPDFIGINLYNGDMVDAEGRPAALHRGFPRTALKWPVTPEVIHFGPMHLHRRYGLPIMITENGLSCNDIIFRDGKVHDPKRIDFLHRYLTELSKAIAEGVPVMGYLQWSFLDNFEWSSGYDERFGIVYVDYPTLRRIPKDSAAWYARVIATNGDCLNED